MTPRRHSKRGRALPAALLASLLACLMPLWASAADLPQIAGQELKSGFMLDGQWRFQPGDSLDWARPGFDDSSWALTNMPASWPGQGFPKSGQMAWYRLSVRLAPDALNAPQFGDGLGLQLGKVMSAYEVYANGRMIGALGQLPPLARGYYDREMVHFLPREIIAPDGRLDIALRVWGGDEATVRVWGGGPYAGTFSLGEYRKQLFGGIARNLPALLFCCLFLCFGLYHLYLYQRNRHMRLFLWFGLMAVNVAIYGFMLTQWKHMLPVSFDTLKKIEYGAIYMLPAVSMQMLWALMGSEVRSWMRAYQVSFVILAIVGLWDPRPDVQPLILFGFQLWTVPLFLVAPVMVLKSVREGNPEARTLFLGLAVFGATAVNDLLIDLAALDSVRMLHFGFAAIMLAMSVSLGNRFTNMLNRLEREVEERTEDLRVANRQLAEAARVEPLTGLLNRRGFIEEAEKEIQRVFRGSPPFALVLADLDHFKLVNDRYGHACGDQVLRRIAAVLSYRVREVDLVARWGGEEFIFLLPETDAKGASVMAESLRQAVEMAGFDYDGKRLDFTMTFGIAAHRKGESLDATVHRADTALYHGKEAGRNRVMLGSYKGLTVVN
ncbi:MAG: diguanylate cyclase [Pseudomonadota bacterium]